MLGMVAMVHNLKGIHMERDAAIDAYVDVVVACKGLVA